MKYKENLSYDICLYVCPSLSLRLCARTHRHIHTQIYIMYVYNQADIFRPYIRQHIPITRFIYFSMRLCVCPCTEMYLRIQLHIGLMQFHTSPIKMQLIKYFSVSYNLDIENYEYARKRFVLNFTPSFFHTPHLWRL